MTLTTGLGFKLEHLDDALATEADGLWFEVHAENYMVEGGPRLAALEALRARFDISLHGVGLSLASINPPPPEHLRNLARLERRVRPWMVSDHLAWQRWRGIHHSDFLPFPRTREALAVVAGNVNRVQERLGRQMLVENPSHYADLSGHEMPEAEFMAELARQTGCGVLLDINNVFVSAHNIGADAGAAIDAFPAGIVVEVHLAGHSRDEEGELLIDTHAAPICAEVWDLYRRLMVRIGSRPTLVERDDNIPPFSELMGERNRAAGILAETVSKEMGNAA